MNRRECLTGLAMATAAVRAPAAATRGGVSGGALMPAAPMLEPRSGHTATLLADGRVLIAGGMRRNQDFLRSAEVYHPAGDRFEAVGFMTERRVGHVAVLLRTGQVLVAGGWTGRDATARAELFDPASGRFTAIAPMTTRRGEPRATLLASGDVLISGGDDHDGDGGHLSSAEVFRVATLSFAATGAMRLARVAHTATALQDGTVLVVGGRGAGLAGAAEIFDPRSGRFGPAGELLTPRYKHTAGLLPDGRVLVAGGSDERDWNGSLASTELYDPATRSFAAAEPMRDSRFKLPEHAVALAAGRLLVAGGSRRAEIFDPVSGHFSSVAGLMSDGWHYMTATRLSDGRALLAGGYARNDAGTTQAWVCEA